MLPIVGWQRTSLIDYPHKLSSVLFTPGCNLRCPYCHNPQLVELDGTIETFAQSTLIEHLTLRRKVLDGVVITGGEPTLHGEKLVEFIQFLKELGYLVKLDTNGTNPSLLQRLIEERLVDYIAMDLKTSSEEYPRFFSGNCQSAADANAICQSIALILQSTKKGLTEHEFRSTLHPLLHSEKIISAMAQMLIGAERYYLQTFNSRSTLDPAYGNTCAFTDQEMLHLRDVALNWLGHCEVR